MIMFTCFHVTLEARCYREQKIDLSTVQLNVEADNHSLAGHLRSSRSSAVTMVTQRWTGHQDRQFVSG